MPSFHALQIAFIAAATIGSVSGRALATQPAFAGDEDTVSTAAAGTATEGSEKPAPQPESCESGQDVFGGTSGICIHLVPDEDDGPPDLLDEGIAAYNAGQMELAEAKLSEAAPGPQAEYYLGLYLYHMGKWQQARDLLEACKTNEALTPSQREIAKRMLTKMDAICLEGVKKGAPDPRCTGHFAKLTKAWKDPGYGCDEDKINVNDTCLGKDVLLRNKSGNALIASGVASGLLGVAFMIIGGVIPDGPAGLGLVIAGGLMTNAITVPLLITGFVKRQVWLATREFISLGIAPTPDGLQLGLAGVF